MLKRRPVPHITHITHLLGCSPRYLLRQATPVLVAFINNRQEELILLGRPLSLHKPWSQYFSVPLEALHVVPRLHLCSDLFPVRLQRQTVRAVGGRVQRYVKAPIP